MASRYVRGDLLGEGTWGHVYRATRRSDGLVVAVKRIKPMDPLFGINFTALREIKFLKEAKSINVVDLKDVFLSGGVLHMVMEFCPFDLCLVIQDKSLFLRSFHTKCYLEMILRGIDHLHKNFVLHRDLKPANLLIGNDGQLKLADFGLARSIGSPENMTSEVVTRWYRAPELLFGAQHYGGGVDMWAVGCIFAEIVLRTPLFPGDTDVEQLAKIFNVLGTPSPVTWQGVDLLPKYIEFEARQPMKMLSLFGKGKEQDVDILLRMLEMNPLKRITAAQALEHPYFSEAPLACDPAELPIPASVKAKMAIAHSAKRDAPTTLGGDAKRTRV